MKFKAPHRIEPLRRGPRGFTLVEVLVALLLLAIIIPAALQGMGTVSRAAELGQRKATAMRVAERVLNEQLTCISQGQAIPSSANGTENDGDTAYPWTMQTTPWARDRMTQMTVSIKFTLRGTRYEMRASTLYDPTAATPGVVTTATNTQ